MQKTKKLLSMLLAFVMVLGVAAPVFAEESALKETDVQTERPTQTKVTVHKLQADSYKADLKTNDGQKHDGRELNADDLNKLGTNVKELDGVTFTYYKLKDAKQLAEFLKDKPATADAVTTKDNTLTVAGTITTAGGKGADVELEEGYYWFIETGKPETVSSSIAVPFGISIPLMNQTKVGEHEIGTVYLKNVHIYPKNVTGNEPEPDKTVGNLVNKHATHDVGDTVTWYMNATIPSNIKDYTKFEFSDTLKEMLDYVGNIEVKYGSGDKTEFTELEKILDANTDYTVVEYNQDTRTFGVKLTEAGIAKIAENIDGITNPKISVKFDTKLNDKAKVDTGNPNEYTLKFNNGNGEDKDKKSDEPKVFTGERKFVKTDSANRAVLAGAKFVVKNAKRTEEQGQYLKKDDATGAISWVKTEAEATVFTTDTNGEITVGKLQFTYAVKGKPDSLEKVELDKNTKLNDYQLVEIQAPEGYAKIKDPIGFEITEDSYKSGAVKIDQGKAFDATEGGTHTEIPNSKLTIPQTGGIGTIIFAAVGIALMVSAVVAMKKRESEEI